MLNVRTGMPSPSEKSRALVLESIPPDRNTPTGTSLTLRSRTAVRSSAMIRSAISPSVSPCSGSTCSQGS